MNIHATALVAPGAELADDVEIGPYCTIGAKVKLAAGVRVHSHVVIDGETEIGAGSEILPFSVLGGPPQHAVYKPTDPVRLVVGARNLIREHVTMNGGSSVGRGVTRIGDDCTFYMGAHVGHDCIVGDHVTMTNNATLGGHVVLGDYVIMGGLSAIQQRSRVGRYAFIGGLAAVNSDVIPYGMVWGNHAQLEGLNLIGPEAQWLHPQADQHLARWVPHPVHPERGPVPGADRRGGRSVRRLARGAGDHRLYPRRAAAAAGSARARRLRVTRLGG